MPEMLKHKKDNIKSLESWTNNANLFKTKIILRKC